MDPILPAPAVTALAAICAATFWLLGSGLNFFAAWGKKPQKSDSEVIERRLNVAPAKTPMTLNAQFGESRGSVSAWCFFNLGNEDLTQAHLAANPSGCGLDGLGRLVSIPPNMYIGLVGKKSAKDGPSPKFVKVEDGLSLDS